MWVGDMELDENEKPTVIIYSPATPAQNNEDFYVNIFKKKLSLIIDARINGLETEADYKPCEYTTNKSDCEPPKLKKCPKSLESFYTYLNELQTPNINTIISMFTLGIKKL